MVNDSPIIVGIHKAVDNWLKVLGNLDKTLLDTVKNAIDENDLGSVPELFYDNSLNPGYLEQALLNEIQVVVEEQLEISVKFKKNSDN